MFASMHPGLTQELSEFNVEDARSQQEMRTDQD